MNKSFRDWFEKSMIRWKVKVVINTKVPSILKWAVLHWLEYWALSFERETKIITTQENHVVTWRYRASINLNSQDWQVRDTVSQTQMTDWIHELNKTKLSLKIWSDVEYAASLEKKYSLFAKGIDQWMPKFKELFKQQVVKYLSKYK